MAIDFFTVSGSGDGFIGSGDLSSGNVVVTIGRDATAGLGGRALVTVKDDGGNLVYWQIIQVPAASNPTMNIPAGSLPEGDLTFEVFQGSGSNATGTTTYPTSAVFNYHAGAADAVDSSTPSDFPQIDATLDTIAPSATITLDAITTDNIVNIAEGGGSVAVTGTVGGDVADGDTVTLTVNGNTYTGLVSSGLFSISVPGSDLVADGDVTVDASVTTTDAAGNPTTATDTQVYSSDQVAPATLATPVVINENPAANFVIATFPNTEAGSGDALTYALGSNPGSAFALVVNGANTELRVLNPAYFNFEVNPSTLLNITTTDPAGNATTTAYTVNLNDTNEPVTIVDNPPSQDTVVTGTVAEIADLGVGENSAASTVSGAIYFADGEINQDHDVTTSAPGPGYIGTFQVNLIDDGLGDGQGHITWDFSVPDSALDHLAVGESITQTYTVTISDNGSPLATLPQTVTVTMTGTNDRPVITAVNTVGAVTEDDAATLTDSGSITFTDADTTDLSTTTQVLFGTATTSVTPIPGPLATALATALALSGDTTGVHAGTVNWDFTLPNSLVNYLAEGETITATYRISVQDDSSALDSTATQDVVVTITGNNDGPTVTAASNTVTEDDIITGSVSGSDPDSGETATLTYAVFGSPPVGLTLNPDGTYEFDASSYDSVASTLTVTAQFTATDAQGATSAPQNLVITINGVNDAPVNAVPGAQTVGEELPLAITGLSVSDVDAGTASITTTLAVQHGTITIATMLGGATIGSNGTGSVTLTGSQAEINTSLSALNGVVYQGPLNYSGPDQLTITTNDGGNSPLVSSGTVFNVATGATVPPASSAMVNGLGGSAGFGEQVQGTGDEVTTPVSLTGVFGPSGLNWFGTTYTSINIHSNGNVSFQGGLGSFGQINIPGITASGPGDMIAVFWTDVQTGAGTAASPGGTSTGSNRVYYDLDATNQTLTVTWDDVRAYPVTGLPNAYQLQIVKQPGDGNFDIIIRYENIDWFDNSFGRARAGFTAADGDVNHFVELPGSGTAATLTYDTTPGNTSVTGVWAWHVSGTTVTNALTDSDTVAITITPINDAPTIALEAAGTLTDTVAADPFTTPLTGTLDATDVDTAPTSLTYSIVGETPVMGVTTQIGTYGTLTVNADGTYSFAPDAAAINALPQDATNPTVQSFSVQVSDGEAPPVATTLSVNIVPSNDDPIIATVAPFTLLDTAINDTVAAVGGSLALVTSDIDTGATRTYSIDGGALIAPEPIEGPTFIRTNALGDLVVNQATGAYAFFPNSAAINALALGNDQSLPFTVRATDEFGGTATQTITINITAANDTPTITAEVADADPLTAGNQALLDTGATDNFADITGSLDGDDRDTGPVLTYTIVGETPVSGETTLTSAYGDLILNINGDYEFVPNSVTINALNAGVPFDVTFNVQVADQHNATAATTLTVTIDPDNDQATIGGTIAGTIAESALVSPPVTTVGGTLTIADVDTGQDEVQPIAAGTAGVGGYGTFEVLANGAWTYTLDNANPTVQALGNGGTLTDTIVVTSADSTDTETITVTITGANDAPTIVSATTSGAVTERTDGALNENTGNLTATGSVTFDDVEIADTHVVTIANVAGGSVPIGSYIGAFSSVYTSDSVGAGNTVGTGIGNMNWTYTVAAGALDHLAAGDTITQVYRVTVTDNGAPPQSVSQDVTITITGTNDAPVIVAGTTDAVGAATEDATSPTLSDTGTIAFDDVDLVDVHTATVLAAPA
ncbi:MAG: beta strand repeat-containing protein, partial [Hyphomicrobiaceae bacterium]